MKIESLQLIAFGPFTDQSIEFAPGPAGLSIVYGPNEAGKSSALRGLKSLLFGIESRSPDDFIHAYAKMRIAGKISNRAGEELALKRRKGRKNTLQTLEGEALDEQVLQRFLPPMTASLFEVLFGIDHHDLVAGGEEILQQKGELGQVLFSASLGSHHLRGLLLALDEEAETLFKPKGSTQRINKRIKQFQQLKSEVKAATVRTTDWQQKKAELLETSTKLEALEAEYSQLRVELSRLERIKRIRPHIETLTNYQKELAGYANSKELPPQFATQWERAQQSLREAGIKAEEARQTMTRYRQQLAELPEQLPLLEQADLITDLLQRSNEFRQSNQQIPELQAESDLLARRAQEPLPFGLPAKPSVLREVLSKRQKLVKMSREWAELSTREQALKDQLTTLQASLRKIQTERKSLSEIPATTTLKSLLETVRSYRTLDQDIAAVEQEVTVELRACEHTLQSQAQWSGQLVELLTLRIPDTAALDGFEQKFSKLEQQIDQLEQQQQECLQRKRENGQRLSELQHTRDIPTESLLMDHRAQRDALWSEIKTSGLPAPILQNSPSHSLTETFEAELIAADEIADRLRLEADRVETFKRLQADQRNLEQQYELNTQQANDFAVQRQRLTAKWESLWQASQITALSPREMRSWRENIERLRERYLQVDKQQQFLNGLRTKRRTLMAELSEALVELGETPIATQLLDPLINFATEVLTRLDNVQQQQAQTAREAQRLELEIVTVKDKSARLDTQIQNWQQHWDDIAKTLGVSDQQDPEEILEGLTLIDKALQSAERSQSCAQELRLHQQRREQYLADLQQVFTTTGVFLDELPPEQAVKRLAERLSDERSWFTQRETLRKQTQTEQEKLHAAEKQAAQAQKLLEAMREEAGCAAVDELQAAIERSENFQRIKTEIHKLERDIIASGEAPLETLQQELKRYLPDELELRLIEAERRSEALQAEQSALAQKKGRLSQELEQLDHGEQAAQLAAAAASEMAALRNETRQFLRTKLAARILRDVIERYRMQHQGPLLQRASEIFKQLTLGSFKALETDYDHHDQAVLMGVRTEGASVPVTGMSTGTRDQLYLALRIAALEHYVDRQEPMPFIVDDVLVEFDDRRTHAALEVLQGLAEKTQVIVFTHHARVKQQAESLQAPPSVHLIELGGE